MHLLAVLAKSSQALYSTGDSVALVAFLRTALRDVYDNIANAEMAAAEAALRSAASSPCPEQYVRTALHSLYKVYALYEGLQHQTIERKVAFVFPVVEDLIQDKTTLNNRLLELAMIIARHHVDIGERENALHWRKVALNRLPVWVESRTRHLTAENLWEDESLVWVSTWESRSTTCSGEPTWYTHRRYHFTAAGRARVEQAKDAASREVTSVFEELGLDC